MEEYKVQKLEAQFGPPKEWEVQKAINDRAKDGWTLFQMSTGAGGTLSERWFYLIFKRSK